MNGSIANERTGGNPFKSLFLLLLLAAVIVFAIQVSLDAFHGDKHGTESDIVDNCLRNNGPIQVWQGLNNKWYQICSLEQGGYGIQVLAKNAGERVKKITNFFKTSGKNGKLDPLPRVEEYLTGPDPTKPLARMAWDVEEGLQNIPTLTMDDVQFILELVGK